ncbi:unnamed protein product [Vicia faba]|uniref:Uncharacterized protein n=1 Tax=Vicia faba TaxID=3906 RepID=A0AAV1A450_VICFA|nr:unnamed protein product [Vicia faba]
MDIIGHKYTWKCHIHHGGVHIYEMIDKALCNVEWRMLFLDAHVKTLLRVDFSDQHPLLISLKDLPWQRSPINFKFESSWTVEEYFEAMLSSTWKQHNNLISNLDHVKSEANRWNLNTLKIITQKKNKLLGRILGIQKIIQEGRSHPDLEKMESKLQ